MREIGLETVALWGQRLWTKMTGIMPYYCQLAEAQIAMGSIFETQNISEIIDRKGKEDNSTQEGTSLSQSQNRSRDMTTGMEQSANNTQITNSTEDKIINNTEDGKNLFSDTPQDGLSAVENGTYLTNATIDNIERTESDKTDFDSTQTTTQSQTGTQKQKEDDSINLNNTAGKTGKYDKDYEENVSRETKGYNANKVQLLKQYQETLQAIPLLIIEQLADLFIAIL